jgi:hypothetical protein
MDAKRNGTLVGIALWSSLVLGCADMNDPGEVASEEAALSAKPDARGALACGPAHDPHLDRDHRFHRRCERYAQKRPHHDGRAGNAHVTTRALMDGKGMTTIEATTGDFDGTATPPGRIDELKLEVAKSCPRCRDQRDVVARAQQPSGYVSATVGGLTHGQGLRVTARVSGIDRDVDVVRVSDEVRYLPDLAAASIDVASSLPVGVPASIAARIMEGQGDEGATADCLLSVDGAAVDRAPGIWVDAGGVVSCHFTTTFATPGVHRLAVDVVNVAPRDYDLSNNHAEVSVQATTQFAFSASAADSTYRVDDVEDVLDPSGALAYHRDDWYGGRTQSVSVSGTWPTAVTFPLASVKATASAQGATWSLVDLGMTAASPPDESGVTCASGSDPTGYNWVGVCTLMTDAGPATQMSVSAFAGDVTYHSTGVCQTTTSYYDCAGGYSWNSGSDPQGATYHDFGGDLGVDLKIVDAAGGALSGAAKVTLAPYASSEDAPRSCEIQTNGEQHCVSHSYQEQGVAGSAQP